MPYGMISCGLSDVRFDLNAIKMNNTRNEIKSNSQNGKAEQKHTEEQAVSTNLFKFYWINVVEIESSEERIANDIKSKRY